MNIINRNNLAILKLPKTIKVKGLFLYCNGCEKQYSCDKLVKCKCDRNKLVYKVKIHIPGTKKVKTKKLDTKALNEAINQTIAFEEELKKNSFQKIKIEIETQIPLFLPECMAKFMCYLHNEDIPSHMKKERSPKYIQSVNSYLIQYLAALNTNGYDTDVLKFTDINDKIVGVVHGFISKRYKKAKTFNHFVDAVNRFTNHTIKRYYKDYENPFSEVQKRKVFSQNHSISQTDFLRTIDLVNPDDCYIMAKVKSRKNPKRKNIYREWLIDGYWLGLFTGGRNDEIAELKWSGIKLHENGEFSHIEINHFKKNRRNSDVVSEEEYEIKEFLITAELGDLLLKLGYDKYKNTDKYILAPEETLGRGEVISFVSKTFSIFYKKLNNGKELKFKHLRKTYISSAVAKFGTTAMALTGHSGFEVIRKNYLDKEVLKQAQRSFSVYENSNGFVPQLRTPPDAPTN